MKMKHNDEIMARLEESWRQKLAINQKVQRDRETALEELGIQVDRSLIGLSSPKRMPHLVNLSEDPLTAELLIYHIKPGQTWCGNANNPVADIKLNSRTVQYEHCLFENIKSVVTVRPSEHAVVLVNDLKLTKVLPFLCFGNSVLNVCSPNVSEVVRESLLAMMLCILSASSILQKSVQNVHCIPTLHLRLHH